MKKIKDLPKFKRPREKLQEKGTKALSDQELIAILIGSGQKDPSLRLISQSPKASSARTFASYAADLLPPPPMMSPFMRILKAWNQ